MIYEIKIFVRDRRARPLSLVRQHLTMRPSISLRQLSNDPFKTHVGDRSPLWKKVREALVVNPCDSYSPLSSAPF